MLCKFIRYDSVNCIGLFWKLLVCYCVGFLKYLGGLKFIFFIFVCNFILSLEGRFYYVMNLEKKNRRILRNY